MYFFCEVRLYNPYIIRFSGDLTRSIFITVYEFSQEFQIPNFSKIGDFVVKNRVLFIVNV
jgi:hypothetical protein